MNEQPLGPWREPGSHRTGLGGRGTDIRPRPRLFCVQGSSWRANLEGQLGGERMELGVSPSEMISRARDPRHPRVRPLALTVPSPVLPDRGPQLLEPQLSHLGNWI